MGNKRRKYYFGINHNRFLFNLVLAFIYSGIILIGYSSSDYKYYYLFLLSTILLNQLNPPRLRNIGEEKWSLL